MEAPGRDETPGRSTVLKSARRDVLVVDASGSSTDRPRRNASLRFSTAAAWRSRRERGASRAMFFFYAGGGMSGFALSAAVSLGMMVLNGSTPVNIHQAIDQFLPVLTFGGLLFAFYAVQRGLSGQFRAAGFDPGLGAGAGAADGARNNDAVFADVINRVRRMHTEVFYGEKNLSVADLRRRLGDRAKGCIERSELEKKYVEQMDCCAICAEQWTDGDIYRVLGCRHCFHIECIDRWALTNARRGKQPTCPLCNTSL